jgi:hypothetical protein
MGTSTTSTTSDEGVARPPKEEANDPHTSPPTIPDITSFAHVAPACLEGVTNLNFSKQESVDVAITCTVACVRLNNATRTRCLDLSGP